MTTRRRGRSFVRAARRALVWYDQFIDIPGLPLDTSSSRTFAVQMPDSLRKGATLVRTIVDLMAGLSVAGTGGMLAMGIVITNDDALAAAALPNPEDDADQPGWLWRVRKSVFTNITTDRATLTPFFVDLRAKRKMSGEDLTPVLIVRNIGSAQSYNINGLIRSLWMKP